MRTAKNDRIDDAGELHQRAVAHQLDRTAAQLRGQRLDHHAAVRFQSFERADLVHAHGTAVPDHVIGQDRGEMAFHPSLPI